MPFISTLILWPINLRDFLLQEKLAGLIGVNTLAPTATSNLTSEFASPHSSAKPLQLHLQHCLPQPFPFWGLLSEPCTAGAAQAVGSQSSPTQTGQGDQACTREAENDPYIKASPMGKSKEKSLFASWLYQHDIENAPVSKYESKTCYEELKALPRPGVWNVWENKVLQSLFPWKCLYSRAAPDCGNQTQEGMSWAEPFRAVPGKMGVNWRQKKYLQQKSR